MGLPLKLQALPILTALLFVLEATGASPTPENLQTVHYATKANSGYGGTQVRDSAAHAQKYLKVPVELTSTFSNGDPLALAAQKHLTIQENGKTFVKWAINPDELLFVEKSPGPYEGYRVPDFIKVQNWLAMKGLDSTIYTDSETSEFWSESRTVFVQAADSFFGLKTSSISTDGNVQSPGKQKTHVASVAQEEFNLHQYVARMQKRFESFKPIYRIQREPLVITIPELNRAMSVRNVTARPGKKWIPGFVLLDEVEGLKLANANHMKPDAFIKVIFKQLGKAAAQLYATTGLASDSLHQQNWAFEVDEHDRFDGIISFKDIGDGNVATKFPAELNDPLAKTMERNRYNESASVNFYGIKSHTTKFPSWIDSTGGGDDPKFYATDIEKAFWSSFRHELVDWVSRVTDGKVKLQGTFQAGGPAVEVDEQLWHNAGPFDQLNTTGWDEYFARVRALFYGSCFEETLKENIEKENFAP